MGWHHGQAILWALMHEQAFVWALMQGGCCHQQPRAAPASTRLYHWSLQGTATLLLSWQQPSRLLGTIPRC